MKSKLLLPPYSLLVLILFNPPPCRAQAEIDPDHFDTPVVARVPAEKAATVKQQQAILKAPSSC
jgi:hypothetical protein